MATPWMQILMDSCDWLKGCVQEEAGERTDVAMDKRLRPLHHHQALKCPRCDSSHTKFCYYNNYSMYQPRYFCKTCRRYWTRGGALRNVPVGGGCRKNKRSGAKKTAGLLHPQSGGATFHQPFPLAGPSHPSVDFTERRYQATLDGSTDRPDLMDTNLGSAAFAGNDFGAGSVIGTSHSRGLSSADFPVPGNHAAAVPAELKAINGRNILSWGWPNADNTVTIDGHGFYAI